MGGVDYCNCPNCQTNDCPAALELEALQKEVERLNKFHIEDMRVTNESADYHMKQCNSLRTQNEALEKEKTDLVHLLHLRNGDIHDLRTQNQELREMCKVKDRALLKSMGLKLETP